MIFKNVQEACDYSVQKMVEQGGQSMRGHGCAYGTDKGLHCAIGWLLDKDDKFLMEYPKSIRILCRDHPDKVPQLVRDNEGIFRNLQGFHDAVSSLYRREIMNRLESRGIDTSGDHWQQWVAMGESNEYVQRGN